MSRRSLRFGWIVLLVGFLYFLAQGLQHGHSEIQSPLIGKPAPSFLALDVQPSIESFSTDEMAGKVWVMNVWATWCAACLQEHAVLLEMASRLQREQAVPVIGLSYKEVRGDARLDNGEWSVSQEAPMAKQRVQRWLKQKGNPFSRVALDLDGRVGLLYGVYGVPETYVIDAAGVIRYKRVGGLSMQVVTDEILPLVRSLNEKVR